MNELDPWHDGMTSPDGRDFHSVQDVSDEAARALLEAGAELAVDECGDNCAGTWWPDARHRRRMLERGLVRKRRGQGTFAEFRSRDGAAVVLLKGGDLRA